MYCYSNLLVSPWLNSPTIVPVANLFARPGSNFLLGFEYSSPHTPHLPWFCALCWTCNKSTRCDDHHKEDKKLKYLPKAVAWVFIKSASTCFASICRAMKCKRLIPSRYWSSLKLIRFTFLILLICEMNAASSRFCFFNTRNCQN